MSDTLEQSLENNLLSQMNTQANNARNIGRRRIALGRALTSQKYNNRLLQESICQMTTHITSLEKKRRESLLIGIRFKQLLDNVAAARGVSEFLEKEQILSKRKQEEERGRRRERYLVRRMDMVEGRQASKLVSLEKLQEIKEKNRRDTISFYEHIERSIENSRESNREKYERVRGEHQRLKEKMRRIEEFKEKRAQDNYVQKFREANQRHNLKSITLRELQERQKELEETVVFQEGRRGSLNRTARVMFPTALTLPEKGPQSKQNS